jgi:hypothetical protein
MPPGAARSPNSPMSNNIVREGRMLMQAHLAKYIEFRAFLIVITAIAQVMRHVVYEFSALHMSIRVS